MASNEIKKRRKRGPYRKDDVSNLSFEENAAVENLEFRLEYDQNNGDDDNLTLSLDADVFMAPETMQDKHDKEEKAEEVSELHLHKQNENERFEMVCSDSNDVTRDAHTIEFQEEDVLKSERASCNPEEDMSDLTLIQSDNDFDNFISINDEEEMHFYSDDSDIEIDNTIGNDSSEYGNIENSDTFDEDMEPLYPGSSVTVGAFMLLITIFCMKHNLVGDGILQLLNIIAFILPPGHQLCTSLHEYKKYFQNLKNPICKHFYCNHCLGIIVNENVLVCPYPGCNKTLTKDMKSYFIEIPVESQAQNLFSQQGFYNKLQNRFTSSETTDSATYKDISDGYLYQLYTENDGPLSQPENISFTFNTDGAPVFKSSKVSVWPLFMVINELPYKLRMMKENMILAGLWFGNQKPSMSTFLSPFLDSFKKLNNGINCFSPERGNFISKAYLLCGTADLPARCMLCNGVQYNGSYSCWKCMQKGETAKSGKGHAHVFPFIQDNPKGPQRCRENVIEDSRNALQNMENKSKVIAVNGIKGPSWLTFFPLFNIIDGIAIDYMHGVLLGVMKLMLKLWFSPQLKNKVFSIHNHIADVDKKLQSIRPTLNITRLPRSIENDLKYWKANEYRSFLLYYSLPVLHGTLDNTRFNHFALLVNAIHILLKNGSTKNEIMRAESFLMEFNSYFEQLYDICYMTLNVHQLVHLADSVKCLGPLYTHSCFSFEDKNGYLLKMIRGTQNIDNQIITGVSFVQKIPELKLKFIVEGTELDKLYKSIESPNILKRGEMITQGIYILGSIKMRTLTKHALDALCKYLDFAPPNDYFATFRRIEMNDNLVYGMEYARMTKRDNSAIMFKHNGKVCFGRVCFFIRLDCIEQRANTVVAYTECLKCVNYSDHSGILSVKKTEITQCVPIVNIIESCMYVSPEGSKTSYICRFPNRLESD
ncbi:unnamed protein product [Mytilus edulis]|uniref:Transposase domain-containing protein n=1 Tax=Mytilus edulis TaxID=6550 RepID=A0A8S3SCD3_MYTED|nr:unnamed protein product [Mytilus edulis]